VGGPLPAVGPPAVQPRRARCSLKLVHGPQGGDQRCSDPRVPVFSEMVHDVSLMKAHEVFSVYLVAAGAVVLPMAALRIHNFRRAGRRDWLQLSAVICPILFAVSLCSGSAGTVFIPCDMAMPKRLSVPGSMGCADRNRVEA
jgi:hypothetical protein